VRKKAHSEKIRKKVRDAKIILVREYNIQKIQYYLRKKQVINQNPF
jgi:hypothetical protein